MQSVNDDMDEIFKSAAENYPLNTNSADWDKVMQQLHPVGEEVPVAPKKNDHKKYLWLLLLLPVVFICNRYTSNHQGGLSKANIMPQQKVTNEKVEDKESNSSIVSKEQELPGNTLKSKTDKVEKSVPQSGSAYHSNTIALQHTISKAYTPKIGHMVATKTDHRRSDIASDKDWEARGKLNSKPVSPDNIWNNQPDIAVDNKLNATPGGSPDNNQKAIPNVVTDSVRPAVIGEDNRGNDSSKTEAIITTGIKNNNNKKGFYAGITFGPDYSTIKFQQIKKSGYSVGILAGYQLNNHWAVETGGLWDKKNYYSEGAYFNTKKITIPYNVKIINVTGTCYMIEIPLNVKYTLANGVKGNWFVLAGSSSYLMKKEDYTYLYDHNSSVYDVYKAYKNSSCNWFSIMNISVGYERTLNNIATIRIEPYIKLPISGVGIGSLPLTSTGLNISITRPVLK